MDTYEIDEIFKNYCDWLNCEDYDHCEDYIDCNDCPFEPKDIEKNFMSYLLLTLAESKNITETELERLKLLYKIYKDAE